MGKIKPGRWAICRPPDRNDLFRRAEIELLAPPGGLPASCYEIVLARSEKLCGIVGGYRIERQAKTAFLFAYQKPGAPSPPFHEGLLLTIEALFDEGARKIYFEATDADAESWLPLARRVFGELPEEGRLKFHAWVRDPGPTAPGAPERGHHEDVAIWALYRDRWNGSEARRLLLEGRKHAPALLPAP